MANLIHGAPEKLTISNADEFGIANSDASYGYAKVLWSTIKSVLKTYFDTIYVTGTNSTYLGYNSIGASEVGLGESTEVIKKITITEPGILIAIQAYVANSAGYVFTVGASVFSDISNAPGDILSAAPIAGQPSSGGGAGNVNLYLNNNYRWLSIPIAPVYLNAGDYWISVYVGKQGSYCNIKYDTGTDLIRQVSSGNSFYNSDGRDWWTPSDSGKKFSIRALFLPE